jgi:hypothetical protein
LPNRGRLLRIKAKSAHRHISQIFSSPLPSHDPEPAVRQRPKQEVADFMRHCMAQDLGITGNLQFPVVFYAP